ncbi:MAG: PQQ-binding-like beta-propeller repeat protein [Rickettsiales bacterium]|nr:PQQ-binding-like beta-propeller repeat protein [Rickettsiales bacterium]
MKHPFMATRGLMLACLLMASGCSTVSGWFSGSSESKKSSLSGERISVLAEDEALTAASDMADMEVSFPDALSMENWPQAGGTATHYIPNIAATLAEDKDEGSVGDEAPWPGALQAAPVVGASAVFAMDGNGAISAHARKAPSHVLWVSKALQMEEAGYGGGLAIQDRWLYAVTSDGHVAALDAKNGKKLWERELKSPVRAAPRLFEDMLLIPTVDSQIFALNLGSGSIRWQHRGINEAASMLGSSVPAATGPLVIVAYNSGELYALSRRNGEPVWKESLLKPLRTHASDSFTGISGDPVVAGRFVFSISTNGLLAAMDVRNGLRVWESRFGSSFTPWASGGYLYVLDTDHRVISLAAESGKIKWITPLLDAETDRDEGAAEIHGPYLVNGQLLLIDPLGALFIVDPANGKLIDQRDFVAGVSAPPAFADGGLYVIDKDAHLHFIK